MIKKVLIICIILISGCTKEGKHIEYYDNGSIKEIGFYKEWKRDSVWTYWYENGNMDSKISWRNGKLNGTISHWHENGVKSDSGFYKGGEEHGQYLQWHKNGKQSMVLLYDNGIEQERECYDEKGIECECDDFWGCK